MPGCILHVIGAAFDPASVLATMSLQPYSVFHKGDRCFPENPKSRRCHETSGFKCEVSSADGTLVDEVRDATSFLKHHYGDLARLRAIREIESMYLDFGYYLRLDGERVMVQCDFLPAELLKLASELGIGIELSLYPKAGEAR